MSPARKPPGKRPRRDRESKGAAAPQAQPRQRGRWTTDLAIMVAAFAVATGIAGLAGAVNLGTALAFGQIGFALAAVYVLLKR